MIYRHYRLLITLYITAICLIAGLTGWLMTNIPDPVFIIFLLISLVTISVSFFFFIRKPLKQIYMFFLSLRCNDSTIRFHNVKDPILKDIYEEMNEIVKESNKKKLELETKKSYYDRILRIMTHEIRNTITPIVSCSEHIISKNKMTGSDLNSEELQVILNQSRNIVDFLDSYHTLTHLPEPEFSLINVKSLCEEMLVFLRNEPGGNRLDIFSPDMTIYADKMQMQLILGNLLRNALQSIENTEESKVELRASISDGKPFITVTDNGPGIPAELQESIFLPFYTTKKSGSGIGLCLSRQIMKLHDGNLTVYSCPEKRITRFTMEF